MLYSTLISKGGEAEKKSGNLATEAFQFREKADKLEIELKGAKTRAEVNT